MKNLEWWMVIVKCYTIATANNETWIISSLMDGLLNAFTGKQLHEIKINIPA